MDSCLPCPASTHQLVPSSQIYDAVLGSNSTFRPNSFTCAILDCSEARFKIWPSSAAPCLWTRTTAARLVHAARSHFTHSVLLCLCPRHLALALHCGCQATRRLRLQLFQLPTFDSRLWPEGDRLNGWPHIHASSQPRARRFFHHARP